MSGPLAGKVAIVTGASKGIGRATALRLAKDGAKVVVNYSSDTGPAEEVASQIGSENAAVIKADVGSLPEVEELVNKTVDRFGRIDILVLSAGTMRTAELEDVSVEEFQRTFDINVKGPFFLVQKAAPHMSKGSNIILLSTSQCHQSYVTSNYILYCMTKGAIEQMTRVLAKGYAKKGIAVNAVAPGPIATELFLKGKSEQLVKTIASFSPYQRIGEPDEVADVVAFLAGEQSRWMTGQVLRVNGGTQ